MSGLLAAVRSSEFSRRRPRTWLAGGMLLATVWSTAAVAEGVDVADLKAVYLERFTRFVQWPQDTAAIDSSKPFVIAVVEDTSFARTVRGVYDSATILGRPVKVVETTGTDIPPCSILYIGCSVAPRLLALLEHLQLTPILTVSQCPSFARRGVHINFFINEKTLLRFEVNTLALAAAGLKMSHLLLGVARVVDPSKAEE